MKNCSLKPLLSAFAIALSLPALADRDDHERHGHRHYRDHHHHDHHYRGAYRESPCRVEGWYDGGGYYRERQVCREDRVRISGPAVFLPPPPAVFLQPPSVVIQPPGVFLR